MPKKLRIKNIMDLYSIWKFKFIKVFYFSYNKIKTQLFIIQLLTWFIYFNIKRRQPDQITYFISNILLVFIHIYNYPFLNMLKIIFGILKNFIYFFGYIFSFILLIIISWFIVVGFIKGEAYLRVTALVAKERHYASS